MSIILTDWNPANPPPDTARIVLVSCRSHAVGIVYWTERAFFSDGSWYNVDHHFVTGTVYAWTELPDFAPAPHGKDTQ